MSAPPLPARTRSADVLAEAWSSVSARPGRTLMSVLGVAVGMAALVGVLGLGDASRAQLLDEIHRLGTNLLTVTPGQTIFGQSTQLEPTAEVMVRRIPGVQAESAVGLVPAATVRRTDLVDRLETSGLAVYAARDDLPATLGGRMVAGTFLNAATARYPVAVLGWVAAARLGIHGTMESVFLEGRRFTVIGILGPTPLAPEVERAALIGWRGAQQFASFDGRPTCIYERSSDEAVPGVLALLGSTAAPGHPDQVTVSRPSDALAAALAAKGTFSGLLVGLGAVALLVGGLGVGNTMMISVLQRVGEIGLRRALGATRGSIAYQTIAESLLLSLLGGVVGAASGSALTLVYASARGWPAAVPVGAVAMALACSVVIGCLAGSYPAWRAATLPPTVALRAGLGGG